MEYLPAIDPAFRSRREVVFFTILCAFFLFLPWLLHCFGFYTIDRLFSQAPETGGAYEYIRQQTQSETAPVDILFLSPSDTWVSIDTKAVEKDLTKEIGRPARVLTLGLNYRGEEIYPIVLREFLRNRTASMMVFYLPRYHQDRRVPHPLSYYWFDFSGEREFLHGLPLRDQLAYFGISVLGAPRLVLSLFRSPQPPQDFTTTANENGSLLIDPRPDVPERLGQIPIPSLDSRDLIFSEHSKDRFHFTARDHNPLQEHFLRILADQAKKAKIHVVLLSLPDGYSLDKDFIEERRDWQEIFGPETDFIGITAKDLFQGLSMEDLQHLIHFREHFNRYGARLVTGALTPALIQVYKEHAQESRSH